MQKFTTFFWLCSGADITILKKCSTEKTKYAGIGATIFFTGLLAALAGGYAFYTVFDNYWIAAGCGIIWGVFIFNLDRFIVSSMRKEGKPGRELMMAFPRLVLAMLISIVIAKPLELKIFEKEIEGELVIMNEQVKARQTAEVKLKYATAQDSLKKEINLLKQEIIVKTNTRDELLKLAREEADGTGGSKKKNLGPIYKLKQANALKGEAELQEIKIKNELIISRLETQITRNDSLITAEINALNVKDISGPAARIEAMSRLTASNEAMRWAEWFIILLFIALETSPVVVKLLSTKGPYDNLLRIEEHKHFALEVEEVAKTNAETKERTQSLPETEQDYINKQLDSALS